jgi:UDP-glucose 4-epimerase
LAAVIDVAASVTNPALTHEVNVTGTLNLLQASVKSKVKRFILASSTAVYGDCKELPVKETARLQSLAPYAASKAAAEGYCKAFRDCYGLHTIH